MSSIYTLIPRPIGEFAGLDMASRYAFGLIYDRWMLSRRKENRERYSDENGVYCVFSREAMAAEMGITVPTLRKAINQLIDRCLIRAIMPQMGFGWRYYVTKRAVNSMEISRDPGGFDYESAVFILDDCPP